mmetsp:Transcript_178359/g.565853  ORF Transcript_178359/g.565853 Transcript_178359/m.565853 type:complete len:220 (-) Transcript_178359:692-1351(-)
MSHAAEAAEVPVFKDEHGSHFDIMGDGECRSEVKGGLAAEKVRREAPPKGECLGEESSTSSSFGEQQAMPAQLPAQHNSSGEFWTCHAEGEALTCHAADEYYSDERQCGDDDGSFEVKRHCFGRTASFELLDQAKEKVTKVGKGGFAGSISAALRRARWDMTRSCQQISASLASPSNLAVVSRFHRAPLLLWKCPQRRSVRRVRRLHRKCLLRRAACDS